MDCRDRARSRSRPYECDHDKLVIRFKLEDDAGLEEEHEVPAIYEVCPLCAGRGRHVAPGIDAHGLAAEDFAEDPDFAEDYFSGVYDVTCYECGGRRVVLTVATEAITAEQAAAWERFEDVLADLADFDAVCEQERRMGA